MNDNQNLIEELLTKHNALLSGHFILSSGKRSRQYVQFARIHEYPIAMKELSAALALKIKASYSELKIDCVVSPAIGAILPGYQLACDLGVERYIFCERNKDSAFEFRRNFEVIAEKNYLIVEDVVTTGGSFKEVANLIEAKGGKVVLIVSFIDRNVDRKFEYPFLSLVSLDIPSFDPSDLPEDLRLIPAMKPGSNDKA